MTDEVTPPSRTSASDGWPSDRLESTLAAIWCEVLGVSPIGADDDFFQLGGDSLLAAEVAVIASDRLAAPIPAHAPFVHPTIRELAEAIASGSLNVEEPRPVVRRRSA